MKPTSIRPLVVDLFSGAGGMSLGFEQAGFDVAAAVEHDPIHCATHGFNFPHCAIVCRSVEDVSGEEIREDSRIGDSEIAAVFGGAPCQGFSMIGKRAWDDPRNRLVYHFVRLVVELQPKYFVFENVRGLTVGKHRQFLEEIIAEFRRCEYAVVEKYQVLNAANFGVPQDRQRLFLIGARKGLPLPTYPPSTHRPSRNGQAGFEGLTPTDGPTVWDALGDLPEAEDYEELLDRDWVKAKFGKTSAYASKLRCPNLDPNDLSVPRRFDPELLTSSMRTVHTALSKRRFADTPFGETEPISRFHKLDPRGICNTIRAGTASDHGAFTSPRPIHPFSSRCITVREAARLHSYPDWFRFHVTKWHGFRQIGNSVPPFLGRAVARQILNAMGASIRRPANEVELGDARLLSLNMSEAAAKYGVRSDVIPRRIRTNGVLVNA